MAIATRNWNSLTFADKTFDVFITQDVMKHGFSAHKLKNLNQCYPRAVIENGKIKRLLEPM